MKRSEILKKIQGLYDLELQMYPKESPSDIFAENLLCCLEQAGMRPPAQETYGISDMQGNNLGELDDVYEWESEDEAK